MTDARPGTERYWSDLAASTDGGDDDPEEWDTILDRIRDELEAETIHGITVTAKRGETVYAVVSQSKRQHGGEVVDLRTVVIDLGADTVKVSRNGLWVPRDVGALEGLVKTLARTHTDVRTGEDRGILRTGIPRVDVEDLLARRIKPDDWVRPDGWGESWGNGQGPPPEAFDLVERLAEAGVETERFSRLAYGEKKPHDREASHPVGGLYGNYGVETLEHDPLIVIDVDAPEGAPVEALPETYRVTSPHGSDDRAHHYYVCPDKALAIEHFGTGAVKPGWGDVWLSGEYVVGPGSMLAKGCGKGEECDGGCGEPGGGRYPVVSDRPIAEIAAADLIDLLESSWLRGGVEDGPEVEDVEADPEPVEEDEPAGVACAACGATIDPDEADLTDLGDGPVYVCGGGCA